MNEKLNKENNFYWIVGLRSDARIFIHAENCHTLDGDLCFFNNDDVMHTAFAKGTWAFCSPASVSDGSLILIEHWNRGPSNE